MALESGTTLGHYEITDPIGRGGMGEVYRARDRKLGREVAIKVLPSEFGEDAERLARLEREARMLAALNHPNIAAIYGLEQSGATRFLVLELVEGDTLADRLERGAIPVEESLRLTLQITEALEAAHQKGVVHRDLKPANIKVTPDGKVKVLDFGLAKAFEGEAADPGLSNSPTLSMQATARGVILGTAAYMSPEQAKGREVDRRADIWAIGAILYEMLSGRRAFQGDEVSEILASVLAREPDYANLERDIPPRLRRLVQRCLDKDPKRRWQDAGDLRIELEEISTHPEGEAAPPAARPIAGGGRAKTGIWAASVVVALVLGAVVARSLVQDDPGLVIRFPVTVPEDQLFTTNGIAREIGISRDGSRIVYSASNQLFIRDFNDPVSRPIQGASGGIINPAFSPDGQWLAYAEFPAGDIKRIPVTGGSPQTLLAGTGTSVPTDLEWDVSDVLLYPQGEGIMRLPSTGGEPELVVAAQAAERLASPQLLPDGETILFTATSVPGAAGWDVAQVFAQRIGSEDRQLVWSGGSDARFLPTGHLVYAQGNTLYVVPFDEGSLETTGTSTPLVEEVLRSPTGATDAAHYAVSDTGTLIYRPGQAGQSSGEDRSVVWVDRDGDETPVAGVQPKAYTMVRVSPDGTRMALEAADSSGQRDLWTLDVRTGSLRQLTTNPGDDRHPVWAPTSDRIYFASVRDGAQSIYVIPADGGQAELVAGATGFAPFPTSISTDGKTLAVLAVVDGGTNLDIYTLSLDGNGELTPLLTGPNIENEPELSPDGNFMASTEVIDNRNQISLRPFPEVTRFREPIRTGVASTAGVRHALFSRDGSSLFFFNGNGISEVSVEYEPNLAFGPARDLFSRVYWYGVSGPTGGTGRAWDWDSNTERFALIKMSASADAAPSPQPETAGINVVVNWFEEVKERVPIP